MPSKTVLGRMEVSPAHGVPDPVKSNSHRTTTDICHLEKLFSSIVGCPLTVVR
jgi:hypothetical protein